MHGHGVQAGRQARQVCRQAGRHTDSSQVAGRQAKLRANKVRQAGRPKGWPGKAGELGIALLCI
jgi:hypothetical protein